MAVTTLVFGPGWLGRQFVERLPDARLSHVDIADEEAVAAELDAYRPARVVNAAGRTGEANIDSLEAEPARTWRSNVAGPIVLGGACSNRGIHLTHLGSGCIYEGDGGGEGFTEEDRPNFRRSLYARTKIASEDALRDIGALQLRIRLPIGSTPAPRNVLTKLLAFERVVVMPNSVTVLDDFWPTALALMDRGETGVWNVVNDGAERHDELLALWRREVDPDHSATFVTPEELEQGVVAGRSNCLLSTRKLHEAGLALPPIEESLPRIVRRYAAALHEAEGR